MNAIGKNKRFLAVTPIDLLLRTKPIDEFRPLLCSGRYNECGGVCAGQQLSRQPTDMYIYCMGNYYRIKRVLHP